MREFYRIKYHSHSGWEADPGFGEKDCVDPDLGEDGIAIKTRGSDFGYVTEGRSDAYTFTLSPPESGKVCSIYRAGLKASKDCIAATYPDGEKCAAQEALFTPVGHEISHIEIVVACCPPSPPPSG